jgi:hypothetical protein
MPPPDVNDVAARVALVCVYVAEDGAKTYELAFVDAAGVAGPRLEVRPDGSMVVESQDADE